MNISEIDKTLKSGYLELPLKNKLTHYSIVFFTGFIALVFTLVFCTKPNIELGLYTLVSGTLSFVFYTLQRNRLKMTSIDTDLSNSDVYKIIEKTARELEWYPTIIQKDIFTGETHPNIFKVGSWGEQITILIQDSKIFINSICDTNKQTSVVSYGRNKRNVQTFIDNLKYGR
jgi:hypothetical protein